MLRLLACYRMSAAMRQFRIILLVFVAVSCVSCQDTSKRQAKEDIFLLPDLGVRYRPPSGMTDKTSPEDRQLREHAASYAGRSAQLLLDISSGEDDTASDWHQVWIFVYPRGLLSKLNDSDAEVKMNIALAGRQATSTSQPRGIVLGGHSFMVSDFERQEPPVLRRARIYTTTCRTQLMSFVLVSTSVPQLNAMEESLKSLDFSTPR